jgi:hypothetical protein
MTTHHTIAEAAILNAEKGFFFFSRDTMAFFNSHICTDIIREHYFITSEYSPSFNKPLRYTVRSIDWDSGDITTVGEFHSHKTIKAAKKSIGL